MRQDYSVGSVVLNDWTLTRQIGAGSFGRVFEAERKDFGRTYKAAIKIITIPQSESELKSARAEGMDEESLSTYFQDCVAQLVDEFDLMSKLKGNSNIVSYEDHKVVAHGDQIGWDIIIRMELLTPLLDYATSREITNRDVIRLGIDLCKALELCQKSHIVHRDIKPENIFVSGYGDFKLGDFGIARTVEMTAGGMSKKGTYNYMAPEVYKGEAYGSSVDIYSLGLVLYWLLNDRRIPFLPNAPSPITPRDRENALRRRFTGEALPAPKSAPNALARVVLTACAYDPKGRYADPSQMRRELEELLSGPVQTVSMPTDVRSKEVPPAERTDELEAAEDGDTYGHTVLLPGFERAAETPTDKEQSVSSTGEASATELLTAKEDTALLTEDTPFQTSPSGENLESYDAPRRFLIRILGCVAIILALALFLSYMNSDNSMEMPNLKPQFVIETPSPIQVKVQQGQTDTASEVEGTTQLPPVSEDGAIILSSEQPLWKIPLEDETILWHTSSDTDVVVASLDGTVSAVAAGRGSIEIYTSRDRSFNYNFQVLDDLPMVNICSRTVAVTSAFAAGWDTAITEEDIEKLSALPNLSELELFRASLGDLSRLAPLTNLNALEVWNDSITDISPLASMTKLKALNIGDGVSDISVLRDLTELEYLGLNGNCIEDITPLSALKNLRYLDLGNNNIRDLSPLAGLTNLQMLHLHYNDVSDFSPLYCLKSLHMLNIAGNSIDDQQLEELKAALPNCDISTIEY